VGGVFTISMSTLEGSVSKLRGCAIVSILVIMGLSLYVHHMTSRNLPDMALTVLGDGRRAMCPATRYGMLVYVTEALDKAGVPYFVMYGTLLGAVRDQAIISWTKDIDLVIPDLGHTKAVWPQLECMVASMHRGVDMDATFDQDPQYFNNHAIGLETKAPRQESLLTFDWPPLHGVYVDVYGVTNETTCCNKNECYGCSESNDPAKVATAKADKDGVFIGAWDGLGGKVIHRSDVYPLRRESVTIQGRKFTGPNKPTALLDANYGAWQAPPASGSSLGLHTGGQAKNAAPKGRSINDPGGPKLEFSSVAERAHPKPKGAVG